MPPSLPEKSMILDQQNKDYPKATIVSLADIRPFAAYLSIIMRDFRNKNFPKIEQLLTGCNICIEIGEKRYKYTLKRN